jgi:hypothetical protein
LDKWRSGDARFKNVVKCELCGFVYLLELRCPRAGEAVFSLIVNVSPVAFLMFAISALCAQQTSVFAAALIVFTVVGLWSFADVFQCLPKTNIEAPSRGVVVDALRRVYMACKGEAGDFETRARIMSQRMAEAEEHQQRRTSELVAAQDEQIVTWMNLVCPGGVKGPVTLICSAFVSSTLLDFISRHRQMSHLFFFYVAVTLAITGFAYFSCASLVLLFEAIYCPRPVAVCGSSGEKLPIIRSLTDAERDAQRFGAKNFASDV